MPREGFLELLDFDAAVDVQHYPITKMHGPRGQALIAQCRRALAEQAICVLPGFVRDDALARIIGEAEAVDRLTAPVHALWH